MEACLIFLHDNKGKDKIQKKGPGNPGPLVHEQFINAQESSLALRMSSFRSFSWEIRSSEVSRAVRMFSSRVLVSILLPPQIEF
jgi:hypothetical protein